MQKQNDTSIRKTISFDININNIEHVKDFCEKASRTNFKVDAVSGAYVVNAKSIMGLFSLDLSKPITCVVDANETEAAEFINGIKPYMV